MSPEGFEAGYVHRDDDDVRKEKYIGELAYTASLLNTENTILDDETLYKCILSKMDDLYISSANLSTCQGR